MAASLAGGLIAGGAEPASILVAEPDEARRAVVREQFGVATTAQNPDTLSHEVVVLAVKPQQLQRVCTQLSACTDVRTPLYVSIAAGIRTADIMRWLGREIAVVRCMPNTPALIRCSATGLYANAFVSQTQKQRAEDIMQSVGMTTWVAEEELLDVGTVCWLESEDQMDAVTAISGSGPAYFFLLMEAMQKSAVNLGLDEETANRLTLQTALGAARMASESDVGVEELRARVTSKGGTTAAAIATFEHHDFHYTVSKALRAAYHRSLELADELGKDQST